MCGQRLGLAAPWRPQGAARLVKCRLETPPTHTAAHADFAQRRALLRGEADSDDRGALRAEALSTAADAATTTQSRRRLHPRVPMGPGGVNGATTTPRRPYARGLAGNRGRGGRGGKACTNPLR